KKKIHYQIAMGDSIDDSAIRDVTGQSLFDVTDQSLFYGGKVILSPFNGWEEIKKTETYMGQGKHFSVGASYWTVPEIKGTTSDDAANPGTPFDLNHELINLEASAHYKGFFIQSEWFKFKDVVEDWDAPVLNVGDSDGWYVTSEYVMTDFYYIAPFVRYEKWDRFKDTGDSNQKALLLGANWYLRGNTTKVGVVYEKVKFDENIGRNGAFDEDKIRITSQFFF
ncbi:MAG: OprO/OprP family phosphate-selective porin, partial [Gammaproteobacteria bacterium]|nr:OprO/OprP family phosphate-selective porin [Gammaproteobacteria bacterium]